MMKFRTHSSRADRAGAAGFSLIEVVLAIGIFLVTILALVGLLGPTLKSVDEVEQTDEVASVVNTLNAFLQKSPEIAVAGQTKFQTIYEAVASGNFATVFIFKSYRTASGTGSFLQVGFWDQDKETNNANALLINTDFSNAAGKIYRVVLTASSVLPLAQRSAARNANGVYTLKNPYVSYLEGSLAMEVRIFAEEPGPSFNPTTNMADLAKRDSAFTYDTAIVR